MSKKAIFCVDDEPLILECLKKQLNRHLNDKYRIELAESGDDALILIGELSQQGIEIPLVISDYSMPGMKGDELLETVHFRHPRMLTILLTGRADANAVGNAVNKASLYRYISKPWDPDDLNITISGALRCYSQERTLEQQRAKLQHLFEEAQSEISMRKKAEQDLQKALSEVKRLKNQLQAENVYLREEIKCDHNFDEIVHKGSAVNELLKKVKTVAPTDSTVLITGETGTGKELIARAIHNNSTRAARPLVKVNCAALPVHLIESELFGHEKGAFTGAVTRQIGRFELANGGTIFLDEIGELPINLQVKLLCVLQESQFERLGDSQTIKVDVRIIAATNRDLDAAITSGDFRQDLYFRLNVFPIHLPPLRDRKEDIPILVDHFISKIGKKLNKDFLKISDRNIAELTAYSWPGNIRELENIIERGMLLSSGPSLEIDELILPKAGRESGVPNDAETLEAVERNHILQVLKRCNWVVDGKNGAANILDINASTLRDRMRKLGIKRPSKKSINR